VAQTLVCELVWLITDWSLCHRKGAKTIRRIQRRQRWM